MDFYDMFQEIFLRECIKIAEENIESGRGGPFAAIIVKDGIIIGQGVNRVTEFQDPTAHAEIVAIRDACKNTGSFQLTDCILYASCEPCPMCLGAIYWARPKAVFYAASRDDAAKAGFDDSLIYKELSLSAGTRKIPFYQYLPEEGQIPLIKWAENPDKNLY